MPGSPAWLPISGDGSTVRFTNQQNHLALPGAVTNTPTNTEKSADIWTPLADMTNNVIMGLNTEDELRSLIAELHEYGIDQILQEANDNYALLMN